MSGTPIAFLAAVNATVAVSNASSTQIVAANSQRTYIKISNGGVTVTWISLGGVAAVGTGIAIPAGGVFELNWATGMYLGAINGIAVTAPNTTGVTEGS